jgi:PAS domain S-box-containing protein
MPELLSDLFSSDGFMPHGHCYLWRPELIWLHVVSDALVALAYTTIPFTLVYLARKRRDIPFNWMFLCFGMFIIACGATHVMEIWTLWTPVYWLSGIVKAITAAASVPTALLLIKLVPSALAIPTPDQLSTAHEDLKRAHEELERRVQERTSELSNKNEQLAKEIVERKGVEAALRRSEGRFRRLADAGIIGNFTANLHGDILDANDAFLSMVGYTREEVSSGRVRWADLTPSEWRHLDERAIEQLQATGIATAWEKEYIRKDGSRVPTLVGVAMLEGTAGECVAFILDVTERKRAEAAVRESEARKTAVMEAALDAIVLMDHEGNITDFNPAAERTFGYARDEVVGKPLAEMLIPVALRAQHSNGLQRYLTTGEAHVLGKRIELPAVRKDGAEFPAEMAVVRIRSEGSPIFTGYIRDITERYQAAEAQLLRRAKEAAEEANAELEAFSYSVAHDLRAPLRAINGFSAALTEDLAGKLDADANDNLKRIASGSHLMSEIIDALLSLARLTRTEARRERVDLPQLARIIVAQLRVNDPERNVDFVAAEGSPVQADPQLVRVLLENLLGNAWKFTRKRPDARIEFGCEGPEDAPVFYVRDNGAGFSMALADKLYAPFRRLHKDSEFEGTGIGLATCQRIVRRHGGRIWAEGAVGAGATFRFTLGGATRLGGISWAPTR